MQQWEYLLEKSDNGGLGIKGLNEFGEKGWELTAVIVGSPGYLYYFKRPKQ